MSDFDEEAERERLRERFEREEQKREATERMSELLLKGATMTNAHCSDCGDPVFRYEGQEFCATCQKAVEREDAAEGDEDGAAADEGEAPSNVEVTTPSEETRVQFGGANGDAAGEQANATDETAQSAEDEDAPTASEIEAAVGNDESTASPERQSPAPQPPETPPASEDVGAAIATARADLAATLQRFARAARDSESPAAAKEHLDAARAAAETLDELD